MTSSVSEDTAAWPLEQREYTSTAGAGPKYPVPGTKVYAPLASSVRLPIMGGRELGSLSVTVVPGVST